LTDIQRHMETFKALAKVLIDASGKRIEECNAAIGRIGDCLDENIISPKEADRKLHEYTGIRDYWVNCLGVTTALLEHFEKGPDDRTVNALLDQVEGKEPPSIACPRCGRVSYNMNDVVQRYCGACHEFHDTMGEPK
jgi:hypothetical protein